MARQRKTAAGKASSDAQPSAVQRCSPLTRVKAQIKFQRGTENPLWRNLLRVGSTTSDLESDRCVYCAEKANCNWHCPLITLFRITSVWYRRERLLKRRTLPPDQFLTRNLRQGMPTGRLCEGACTLKDHSGAVSIGNWNATSPIPRWRWAGVPMSASCSPYRKSGGDWRWACRVRVADILARAGVQVDVFDRHPEMAVC